MDLFLILCSVAFVFVAKTEHCSTLVDPSRSIALHDKSINIQSAYRKAEDRWNARLTVRRCVLVYLEQSPPQSHVDGKQPRTFSDP